MLSNATLVIWVGPTLTPWLNDPLDALSNAPRLTLLETEGWTSRELHDDDGHGHDHGHDHGDIDPHAWLDPMIAATWAGHIAETLAVQDPDNATLYRANAATLQADLTALTAEMTPALAPFADTPFVMPHDAFGYFEDRFALTAAAAIADSDAHTPGPARLSALRDRMAADDITCVLIEPGPDQGWTTILTDGTDIKTATLDLIGSTLSPGPELYPQMMRNIRDSLENCLG
jgi:zinc transport system substrate-binding protein